MDKYYVEIDPVEKIDEILELFKEFCPKIYSKTDEGYDWIEEDFSRCIVFVNPFSSENLEINVGDSGEFTLFFSAVHAHYFSYQSDYEEMLDTIKNILSNKLCAGTISNLDGKWFGSGIFKNTEVGKNPQEVFDFVFKEKEFRNTLLKTGFEIKYTFWNPANNQSIKHTV